MTDIDPQNEATYCECRFSSCLGGLRAPQEDILRRAAECGFSEQEVFAIKLALEEAFSNAVKHGNCCDPKKDVTVRYAVTPETLVVIVRDEGTGFTPAEVPDPTAPDRLSVPSGRGIMLLRAYMDEVEYRDNGREVRFAKHRSKP